MKRDRTDQLLPTALAARSLGIAPRGLRRLVDSGFLTELTASRLLSAAAAPDVEVTRGALPVVRVGAPQAVDEGAQVRTIGVAAGMDDSEFLDATARWWMCEPNAVVDAGILAVSVSSFVVGLLAIHGVLDRSRVPIEKNGRVVTVEQRIAFDATLVGRVPDICGGHPVIDPGSPFAALAKALLGGRVDNPRGAPLILVTGQPNVH